MSVCACVYPSAAEVNQSTHFEKHLRNLRPGYDWVPAPEQTAAAAAANGQQSAEAAGLDGSQQQQQQQAGRWLWRHMSAELLHKCNMEPAEVEVRAGG